jgi:hypothetical protein
LKIKNGFLKKYKRTKDVFEQLKLVSCRRWWPCLTAAAAAAQWARRSVRGCRGFRGLRQAGPAARGRGAAGGRGQGHSRDISPIVPQREQKRTEGARQSPRECPGTPHLQHRDSGRGSRVRRGCPPFIHLAPPRRSGLRPRCRSGRGLELGPGRSRWPGRWNFLGLPRGGLWVGLALARVVSLRRAGGAGGAGGLGSGLPAEARAVSTSSTTVHSRSSSWPMALVSSDFGGTCG